MAARAARFVCELSARARGVRARGLLAALLLALGALGCNDGPGALPRDAQPDNADQPDARGDAPESSDLRAETSPGDAAADRADAAPAWPEGFALAPRHVPAGLLCDIPADYIARGGDPTNPPCALEVDQLAPPPPGALPTTLSVVSWNVEFGKDTAAVRLAFAQRAELRDADVILLQEVPRGDGKSDPPGVNLARELAQALHRNYAFGVEWDRHEVPAGGEHGLATLSRFPIGNAALIRHTKVWPGSYYDERKEYGGKATLAVDLVVGGQRLRVYNAHFENRDATGLGRAAQCAEVRADAESAGQPARQLLGGDLNTFLCNPALLDCTTAPWAEPLVKELLAAGWVDLLPGYASWTLRGLDLVPLRLDWIFARGLTPTSHAVLQDVRAADHVPLVATTALQ
jgi:endonuclease/exonuclease/phosphatase family metal-dependent hydrolase